VDVTARFVLHLLAHPFGDAAPELAVDEVDGEVEAGRDAARRQHVAVVDDARRDHLGVRIAEVVERAGVGRRRATVEDAGPCEQHAAGAHRRERRAVGVCVGDGVRDSAALGFRPGTGVVAVVPPAAGNDEQVGGAVVEGRVHGDRETVAGDDALAVVGNAAVRYPQQFGTSCLVETADEPAIAERALAVLDDAGYHGISEAEFVYDADRDEFLLLDVNTRPWKWIGLPVAAGANLPMAAYAAVTDAAYESEGVEPARWVYLRDYLSLLAGDDAFRDRLSPADWRRLVSGAFEREGDLTTAVYRPSDPAPAAKLFETEFVDRDYYCSC